MKKKLKISETLGTDVTGILQIEREIDKAELKTQFGLVPQSCYHNVVCIHDKKQWSQIAVLLLEQASYHLVLTKDEQSHREIGNTLTKPQSRRKPDHSVILFFLKMSHMGCV